MDTHQLAGVPGKRTQFATAAKNEQTYPRPFNHVIISASFLEAEQLVDEQGAARGKSLKGKMLVAWSDDDQALSQLPVQSDTEGSGKSSMVMLPLWVNAQRFGFQI